MRRATLGAVAAVAVLAGLSLAGLLVAAHPVPPIHIPLGHVGDRVEYALAKQASSGALAPVPDGPRTRWLVAGQDRPEHGAPTVRVVSWRDPSPRVTVSAQEAPEAQRVERVDADGTQSTQEWISVPDPTVVTQQDRFSTTFAAQPTAAGLSAALLVAPQGATFAGPGTQPTGCPWRVVTSGALTAGTGRAEARVVAGVMGTQWVGDGEPYAAIVQDAAGDVWVRTAWVPGDGPELAVGSCKPSSPQAPAVEAPQRSGAGVAAPEDGSLRLALTLEQARRTAEAYAPYAAWSLTHPDGVLAGIDFYGHSAAASPDTVGAHWYLYYASGVQLFGLDVRDVGAGQLAVQPLGLETRSTPWVDPHRLVHSPVTLAHAVGVWQQVSDPALRSLGANRISWGVSAAYVNAQGVGHAADLQHLRVGHTGGLDPLDATSTAYDWLDVNLTTGRPDAYTGLAVAGLVPSPSPVGLAQVPAFGPSQPASLWTRAATVGAVALMLVGLVALVRAFGLLPGFSKLDADDVLGHPLRRRIQAAIEADPGVSPPELQRRLGAAWSTLAYHVRVLERRGHVRGVRDGRHRRLFPAGQAPGAVARAAVLRQPTTAKVLATVVAQPGVAQAAIARQLGITPQAVVWHVDRLAAHGLVERRRTAPRGVWPLAAAGTLGARQQQGAADAGTVRGLPGPAPSAPRVP